MVLPDVNVLVHAWRPDADRHEAYRRWLEETVALPHSFALSDVVLSGFLRVVTHPNVVRHVKFPEAPFRFVSLLRERPNCTIVAPGRRHWQIFVELCQQTRAQGNFIADAYHAALAIEHGCEWITADRGFDRFPGLRWRHPLD